MRQKHNINAKGLMKRSRDRKGDGNILWPLVLSLVGLTTVSGIILTSVTLNASANTVTSTATARVTVAEACLMTANINPGDEHNATLIPGVYSVSYPDSPYANGIGKTTITVFCNDSSGFAIYAMGDNGNTNMVGASTGLLIPTGNSTSGDISQWTMKVTKVDDGSAYHPENLTIMNNFDNYHVVPSSHTKVAEFSSVTDGVGGQGSKIATTYAAYVSPSQTADTYEGKVKYTLVHPSNAPTPCNPYGTTIAEISCMQDINDQNKASIIASMTPLTAYTLVDSRDKQSYTVAKLADNKVWMTKNLNITGGTTLTPDDTDIASNYTLPASNSANADGTMVIDPNNPQFANNSKAYVFNSNNENCTNTTPCYSYYSFVAATAGSNSSGNEAPYSICPKGWKLPSTASGTNSTTDYRALAIALGGSASVSSYTNKTTPKGSVLYGIFTSSPYNFAKSKYFQTDAFSGVDDSGRYWSSYQTSSTGALTTYIKTDNVSFSNSGTIMWGMSVRCVVR